LTDPSRELNEPPGHGVHVPLDAVANCPDGHGTGVAVPEGHAKPSGQALHAYEPGAWLNRPAGQPGQTDTMEPVAGSKQRHAVFVE
jgi:hypothetical protein